MSPTICLEIHSKTKMTNSSLVVQHALTTWTIVLKEKEGFITPMCVEQAIHTGTSVFI